MVDDSPPARHAGAAGGLQGGRSRRLSILWTLGNPKLKEQNDAALPESFVGV